MLFAIGPKDHLRTSNEHLSACWQQVSSARSNIWRKSEEQGFAVKAAGGETKWCKCLTRINQQFPQTVHSRFSFLLKFSFNFTVRQLKPPHIPWMQHTRTTHKRGKNNVLEEKWNEPICTLPPWERCLAVKHKSLILIQGDCSLSPQLWLSHWAAAAAHWCCTLMVVKSSIYMQYIYHLWQTPFKNSW